MVLNPLLHYDCITEFNQQYYADLLTTKHIGDGELLFKGLHDADGNALEGTIPGFPLNKGGIKYIIPSRKKTEEGVRQINLLKDLPIKIEQKEKIFSGGTGYQHIKKFKTTRFKPDKRMTFKQLVDKLCDSIPHSNEDHNKLMWFISLTSMLYRFNCRVSTPPAFGKDSRVQVMGNLLGNATTITNPTHAKLEFLSISNEWLAVNEVVDMTKTDWRNTEQYLLTCGDFSPTVTKRSRAFAHVGEVLDVRNLSLSLFYNDIDQYPNVDKFFDEYTKGAVKDRFVPFRLHGGYRADFNQITSINIKDFVKEKWSEYDDIIRTYLHYKNSVDDYLHYYSTPDLSKFSERWRTNLGRLLKVIDIYSESQAEFDKWWTVIQISMNDYNAMLSYPYHLDKAIKRNGEVAVGKFVQTKIKPVPTFIERNRLLKEFSNNQAVTGGGLNDW